MISKHRLAVAAIFLGLSLVILEVAARVVLGLTPLQFTRPFDPFFVSGDLTPPLSRYAMSRSAAGPLGLGYQDAGGFFTYSGTSAVSMTSRADFLFGHSLSRYGAQDVDRISCGPRRGIRVFVIGGSLAVGSSATSKDRSWHALLERDLRDGLGRQDVYVFNAAMGAFVSWQERLAFELAARPRDPDLVIVMNGYNDLLFPAWFGTRPGDPFQTGLRYAQIYDSPVRRALVESSAVAATLSQGGIEREIALARSKIVSSPSSIHQYANNIARTYRENITAITESCRLGGYPCIVALQPLKAVIAPGVPSGDVLSNQSIMDGVQNLAHRNRTELHEQQRDKPHDPAGGAAHARTLYRYRASERRRPTPPRGCADAVRARSIEGRLPHRLRNADGALPDDFVQLESLL